MVLEVRPVKTEYEIDIEWRKCKRSLLYYLSNYVWIQDRIKQAIVHWESWEHLLQLVNLVQEWADADVKYPLSVVIFKSRQVGATTTICGIAKWLASFFQSTKVEFESETGEIANEMLTRIKFINEREPNFFRLKMFPSQDNIIGYPASNAKLVAMGSTATAGRASDTTMVVNDEWETHPYAVQSFGATRPAMMRGGIFIGNTTINKQRAGDVDERSPDFSLPQKIYTDAKQGRNNFIPLFWGYFSVPGRTDETWQRDTAGMPDWQKEAEYPRTEAEMLAPSKTTGYFNHDVLEKYLQECRDPIEQRYGGLLKIYTPPVTSRKFCFAIDPSEGQDDPSAGIIADSQTDEDVACFHGKISIDEQAKVAHELYKEYNEPLIAVERNASGLTLIDKLENLGVKNWFYGNRDRDMKGWYTGSRGVNRDQILLEFAESVHLRRKRIPIKDCINQMFDFAWVNGRPQAVRGKHDDWIMCEAILGQVLKEKSGTIKFATTKYRG